MAKYLVIADFDGGGARFPAGYVLDDTQYDLVALSAAGMSAIPYLTSQDPTIAKFQSYRASHQIGGELLVALLQADGKLPPASTSAPGIMTVAQVRGLEHVQAPPMSAKFVDLPDGVLTEMYPAAPAGYLNLVTNLRLNNAGGAGVLNTITDDALGIVHKVTIPVGGVTGASSLVLSAAGAHAISAGAGTSLGFALEQIPVASAVDLLFARVVLTSTYQVVPLSIPAGKAARVLSSVRDLALSFTLSFMMNADSAAQTTLFKYTRGSFSYEYSGGQAQGGSGTTNGRMSFPQQPLEAGDQLEVKLSSGPVIPGSCVLFLYYLLVDKPAA